MTKRERRAARRVARFGIPDKLARAEQWARRHIKRKARK